MADKTNRRYPRVIIAGTKSGVGKTTITLGLLSHLKAMGLNAQPYKVGPDYIDISFHSAMAGLKCRNLDGYMLSKNSILELYERQAIKADISIIEGVMGLFDGSYEDANVGSTAQIAEILKAPVILVVDASKAGQSVAAQVLGFQKFSDKIRICGVIANRVSSERHYLLIKKAVEERTSLPLFGYMEKNEDLMLEERHLGLKSVFESGEKRIIKKFMKGVCRNIDVEKIIKISRQVNDLPRYKKTIFNGAKKRPVANIAVAYDECFHFYYEDNLEMLEHMGAKLTKFSPLKDRMLPENIDGLYIGGGFPELFSDRLSDNKSLLSDIKKKSRSGTPIYAECGGLMYLMKKIKLDKQPPYKMADVFPGTVRMGKRLQNFGYHKVKSNTDTVITNKGNTFPGHMFHWSYVEGMDSKSSEGFTLTKSRKKVADGYVSGNTLANYIHIHFASKPSIAKKFIRSCVNYKQNKGEI